MEPIRDIPLRAIESARTRIMDAAVRTPLLPVELDGCRIWLKLECLQPIGSFKIRGAANAMSLADPTLLAEGVYTASAGNMAQGVAFAARNRGIPCRVIVPDTAPRTKVSAICDLGATVVSLRWDEWWTIIREHGRQGETGFFIHPVSDPAVIAGNGTVGLEILDDLPDVDTVFVPYGGGGLSCGIASAIRAKRGGVRVYAAEVETAAPLSVSIEAGRASTVERVPTFVDGIGGASVLEEMWPLASTLLDGSHVKTIAEICEAIRALAL
ncbi:MAG: pyridoxal-phosphate dependent enzyme, partial [Acidobacteriota bacterium]|nr:pyridoxal-phosphate dependent enzyme [Acidobacteriota bacterium]